MSLELRKNSKWWYGVFMVNGKKTIINLGVPITGKRPPKRTMLGDDEFERSRGRAMEAYEEQRRKNDQDRTGEKALTKLAEMKTSHELTCALASWRENPPMSERPISYGRAVRRLRTNRNPVIPMARKLDPRTGSGTTTTVPAPNTGSKPPGNGPWFKSASSYEALRVPPKSYHPSVSVVPGAALNVSLVEKTPSVWLL